MRTAPRLRRAAGLRRHRRHRNGRPVKRKAPERTEPSARHARDLVVASREDRPGRFAISFRPRSPG
ncbi:hypothetical protein [Lysobacter gummosus]|uniref:hypothetical protein n=1 Tax=Lysobacter gummosus TaxID=262324 RepID=UPI003625DBEC